MSKIIGNTVGMGLPKPNLMQDDPTKGDYIRGKEEFLRQVGNPGAYVVSDEPPDDTSALWIDTGDDSGDGYALTDAEMQEIARMVAEMVEVPSDAHINDLINTALGVIENGYY